MLMPKGAAGCCTTKAVLVTVYVVKPNIAGRSSSPQRRVFQRRNHQLLHNRHRIKQAAIHHQLHNYPYKKSITGGAVARRKGQGGEGNGYDRKAELLRYSHRLRESAKSMAFTPVLLTSHTPLQVPTKSKPVGGDNNKHRFPGFPTCFGKFKILFNPRFISSLVSFNSCKSAVRRMKNKKHRRRRLPGATKLRTARVQKKCAALLSKLFSRIRLCR
ncbi:hypothetical protein MKW94_006613 [Papaver nudicaule]|uniref:Uncharacterized protein n=1 Tax=Papaver nudicaule TaxID=74823 RepID=A0AA41S1Z8_PAPNU|nr:hypothetical protein [Papaver nudicaule]